MAVDWMRGKKVLHFTAVVQRFYDDARKSRCSDVLHADVEMWLCYMYCKTVHYFALLKSG